MFGASRSVGYRLDLTLALRRQGGAVETTRAPCEGNHTAGVDGANARSYNTRLPGKFLRFVLGVAVVGDGRGKSGTGR